jgi:PfaD family protein
MTETSQIMNRQTAEVTAGTGRPSALGAWSGDCSSLTSADTDLSGLIQALGKPLFVVSDEQGQLLFTQGGTAALGAAPQRPDERALVAFAPPLEPAELGSPDFCRDHGIDYPYMCGAMANGIASVELVKAASENGLLASYGAGGLMMKEIEAGVDQLVSELQGRPFCVNLIHTPNEKGHEDAVIDLLLDRQVRLIEASAYMALTPAVVRYRVCGIHRDSSGRVVAPNRIIAKASRVEVATRWFSPPPEKILKKLVASGQITADQATLAAEIPMARDLTVEADSGGHTDKRPAITLVPTMIALRDRLQKEFGYSESLRVGAAGGIATPASAAAAFAMGAAYVVTGTVNQACVESGSSDIVRKMLAEAEQADVIMAPAVDMFEMGVELQVLKRGTMFALRGKKLYELYRRCNSIEEIPQKERESLEKTVFRMPLGEVWRLTREFFSERDPEQVSRAERDPKHKMALIFRWYLGLSSRWANAGEASRQIDYQVWCGPAMGAFNEWTRDSFLAEPDQRTVVGVARNLIHGAAVVTRINQLKQQGVMLPQKAQMVTPLKQEFIESLSV